jgi:hypothetical protein
METRRLRKLQQPSQVERLLEAVMVRGKLVPDEAYQIRDSDAVPSALQRIAAQSAKGGRVWACWANGVHHWLFTAEMSLETSRERGTPVLLVNRYREDGELLEAASWMSDPEGQWRRCAE